MVFLKISSVFKDETTVKTAVHETAGELISLVQISGKPQNKRGRQTPGQI